MSDAAERILTVLETSDQDLAIREIAERADLTRQTVARWVDVLHEQEKIIKTREFGGSRFYDTPEG